MIVRPDCVPCYLKQAISTLRVAGVKEEDIGEVLYKSVGIIPNLSLESTPAENSTLILHKIYELLGNQDPYINAKKEWNEFVLDQYDKLESIMEESKDRLLTAFKVSVAGNIIDMGITPDFDVNLALKEITAKKFDYSDYQDLKELLHRSKNILILGDNSGEIVFDKILVRELKRLGYEVVYSVKGGPILNDATMKDAEEVGMTQVCRVITTGNNYLGVFLDKCASEFVDAFKEADLVISKGQANYESLEGRAFTGKKTFFVLRAKCQLVAESLGVSLGSIVLQRNSPRL